MRRGKTFKIPRNAFEDGSEKELTLRSKISIVDFVCDESFVGMQQQEISFLVEINLLWGILWMVDCLHILRVHPRVGVVEHLLHR